MAIITPQTDVYLIKCPLELNDSNQLTFATAAAQSAYFLSLPKLHVGEDFTYQRKDGVMRVPALIDDLYGYNYCMYKNAGHSNKWFFAFITGMEYLNDSVTGVSLKTDTYQTWMFNLTYKRTFVEREHVNVDSFSLHTVPEGIDYGDEYIVQSETNLLPFKNSYAANDSHTTANLLPYGYMIVFQVTETPQGATISTEYNNKYNGLFSGLYYFGVKDATDARRLLARYAGNAEAVISIFYAPCSFFDNSTKVPVFYDGVNFFNIYIPAGSNSATSMIDSKVYKSRPTTIGGYTPKNNKCFCYPYTFLKVDNNAGDQAVFRFEDFDAETGVAQKRATLGMFGALGQGCAIKLVPYNYKNSGLNNALYNYGVVGAKLPQCAWKSDYYTNWVTQNGVNIGSSTLADTLSTGLSAMGGMMLAHTPEGRAVAGLSAGTSVFNSVSKTISSGVTATIHPDQARGAVSSCDLNVGYNAGTGVYYTLQTMTIKPEYAKIVDDYFSTYGYKINEVKVPNVTGRRNWNFVKTIGCYIEANIPQEDLEEIKSMFDKGITFWHNPSTFMDYSQNNDII